MCYFEKYWKYKGYYNFSHLSICGRASELASQAFSHFIRFSEKELPYCVFCLLGVDDINRNKIPHNHSHYKPISLEGAKIG